MIHKVTGSQNVTRMCHVCGVENEHGLRAGFYELESGDLAGCFRPKEEHQGYPGRLHGGVISAFLDETIGRTLYTVEPETWCVTLELTIKYKRPVPIDSEVRAVARIVADNGRLFEATGEIVLPDGTVAAEGRGKYLRMRLGDVADETFADEEWFPDDRPLPVEIQIGD